MKRTLSLGIVLLAVVGFALLSFNGLAAAQTGKSKAPAKGKAGAAGKAVDAAALYKQHCQKCHAPDGKGIESLEPPDLTSEAWQAKATDKEIEECIKEGKGIMPGFKDTLSAPQIAAMVKFVRSLGPGEKK